MIAEAHSSTSNSESGDQETFNTFVIAQNEHFLKGEIPEYLKSCADVPDLGSSDVNYPSNPTE